MIEESMTVAQVKARYPATPLPDWAKAEADRRELATSDAMGRAVQAAQRRFLDRHHHLINPRLYHPAAWRQIAQRVRRENMLAAFAAASQAAA